MENILETFCGGLHNINSGKWKLEDFERTCCTLIKVLREIKTEPNGENVTKIVHDNISPLLSDIVCIHESDLKNPSLPYVELFALFIELFTKYNVEVCSLEEDGIIFLQIDEVENKFYFAFFSDRVEYAFDNFNEFETIPLSALVPAENLGFIQGKYNLGQKVEKEIIVTYNCYQRLVLTRS